MLSSSCGADGFPRPRGVIPLVLLLYMYGRRKTFPFSTPYPRPHPLPGTPFVLALLCSCFDHKSIEKRRGEKVIDADIWEPERNSPCPPATPSYSLINKQKHYSSNKKEDAYGGDKLVHLASKQSEKGGTLKNREQRAALYRNTPSRVRVGQVTHTYL